jgi:hypothetical protein
MPDDIRDRLVAWAHTDDAAKAVWSAWVKSMQHQYRDVDRHRMKWDLLDSQDKLLDGMIAVQVISAALDAVEGVADGH